jgi:hypothetical protein
MIRAIRTPHLGQEPLVRVTLSLLFAGTVAAVAGAIALSAPPATAIECQLGTQYRVLVTVEGHRVGACVPGPGCDPGPCTPPPTAVPPR